MKGKLNVLSSSNTLNLDKSKTLSSGTGFGKTALHSIQAIQETHNDREKKTTDVRSPVDSMRDAIFTVSP